MAFFWNRAVKTEGCWMLRDAPLGQYARVVHPLTGKQGLAHRIAYELTGGTLVPGRFVCHHCDNPACVRPDHLYSGTARDNNADTIARGRRYRRLFGARPA